MSKNSTTKTINSTTNSITPINNSTTKSTTKSTTNSTTTSTTTTNIKKQPNLNIYSLSYTYILVNIILIQILVQILIPYLAKLNYKDDKINIFESYYTNNYKNRIMEFIMIFSIIKLAELFPKKIPIHFNRLFVIIIYSLLIYIYINKIPNKKNGTMLLLTDFIQIKQYALLWYIFYIMFIGFIADYIDSIKILDKKSFRTIFYSFIGFITLHL